MARSVSQVLSLKDKCTFLFSNFFIFNLFNPSANCWFDITSLLITYLCCVDWVSDRSRVTAKQEDF